jgi:beta-lactamase superfamily II metal-dependent hydrolase
MPDYYEVDFLPVHTSKSGDAIAIRFQIGANWWVHVVDGGYTSTAPDMAVHIRQVYGTNHINRVVVTHPDQDHAEGLVPILKQFDVEKLWMLRPWAYVDVLLPHFSRYTSAQALKDRLRGDYPYIEDLEKIALQKGIPIFEPFQGAHIGPFTVLAPSRVRYFQLILQSERTPQLTPQMRSIIDALTKPVAAVISFIRAGWGSERFSSDDTSVENEMSVVQYAYLNGQSIVLTADAGREALTEAANFAPAVGLFLPGVDRFQVPHHGGRRNVSTELLDRWLGRRLAQMVPHGQERFTAMISSAKEDRDHPRKAVIRALLHRGALIGTTEDGALGIWNNAPPRSWNPLRNPIYPDEQEA